MKAVADQFAETPVAARVKRTNGIVGDSPIGSTDAIDNQGRSNGSTSATKRFPPSPRAPGRISTAGSRRAPETAARLICIASTAFEDPAKENEGIAPRVDNLEVCKVRSPGRVDTFQRPGSLSRTERHPPSESSAKIHDGAPVDQIGSKQTGSTRIAIKLLHQAAALNIDRMSSVELIGRAITLLYADQGRTCVEDGTATVGRKHGGLTPWQMRKVAGYVDAMLAFTITVSDCARLAGLSAGHFSRGFKASFGQTLIGYVVRRRTERAKERMILTDEPLCQIALTCGFADQSHLSRIFRRLEGVTPGVWRHQRGGCSLVCLLM
jgi:AraC family transcriptional regulator